MNQYDIEREMVQEVIDGNVYDFTKFIKQENMEEELAELLFVWSTFRSQPEKMAAALSRHIAGIACRAAKEKATEEICATDMLRDYYDTKYQELKDRRLEDES